VDADEQTPAERARVLAAVHAMQPVRMRRRSDDRIVPVDPGQVAERLASGKYKLAEEGQ
jgi:hypothetical protein